MTEEKAREIARAALGKWDMVFAEYDDGTIDMVDESKELLENLFTAALVEAADQVKRVMDVENALLHREIRELEAAPKPPSFLTDDDWKEINRTATLEAQIADYEKALQEAREYLEAIKRTHSKRSSNNGQMSASYKMSSKALEKINEVLK